MKKVALVALGLLLGLAMPAVAKGAAKPAAPTLPAYFTIPPSITIASEGGGKVGFEDFGEATFWQGPSGSEKELTKQGKHWSAPLELKNPPKGIEGKGIWAVMKPALLAGGWTIPDEYDSNPFSAMMRYQKDGKDVWGYIKIFGTDDMRLNLVELASQTTVLVLPSPGATPEKFDVKKTDFPWLLPIPGSAKGSGGPHGQMEVTMPGSGEVAVVGTDSQIRFYPNLPTVSNVQFLAIYKDALTKAGWTIIEQNHGADATTTAHYARNGRDIWAYLHMGGEEYSIQVADAGADNDIARQFAKDCHVALYGVLFDFNKATLKPESDGVLQRVLAFLQKDPKLALEVQGHTDNVGGDDYNQKLSDARSKSVLAWLTQHGIAASRLSFKGYGKTRPVATNDTDEGRAKNRRVEIARPGCTK